jgi:hypothetical protein
MNKDKKIEQLITDYSQYTITSSTGTGSQNHLATSSVVYLIQGNIGSITGTITTDQTLKRNLKALIRIAVEEKSLNKFFENTKAIAKIRMAEFLRYSHEQFLIY